MIRRRRITVALTGLIIEILALILTIVGLYIRLWVGDPIGSAYIWIGAILAMGGSACSFWLSSQLKPK